MTDYPPQPVETIPAAFRQFRSECERAKRLGKCQPPRNPENVGEEQIVAEIWPHLKPSTNWMIQPEQRA